MNIETDGKVTTATKNKGNLFTLKIKRVPSGVQLDFESKILKEYFASICHGKDYEAQMANWKKVDGGRMIHRPINTDKLPNDLTGGLCFNKADRQLYVNGYANLSWFGCQSLPVIIAGVYTQKTIDNYCQAFTEFSRKIYLTVLKPYSREVTLTYSIESKGGK